MLLSSAAWKGASRPVQFLMKGRRTSIRQSRRSLLMAYNEARTKAAQYFV
jgi:hypothetical protein